MPGDLRPGHCFSYKSLRISGAETLPQLAVGFMNQRPELTLDEARFAKVQLPRRIWTVASIHGEAEQLAALHDQLIERFTRGDRLVYLGNYLGVGPGVRETVDELLRTRRRLFADPGVYEPGDFIYLRGAQEEMWSKLLQLQFAPNPREIFEWLLDHGVGPTIEAYGGTITAARANVRDGPLAITKWTSSLRANVHRSPGHRDWFASLKRAAYTTPDGGLLFVHASVDPARPLSMQGDVFWWDTGSFDTLDGCFSGFARVIRGYDHKRRGVMLDKPYAATIDGGCGFGGKLVAICFDPAGEVLDRIEA